MWRKNEPHIFGFCVHQNQQCFAHDAATAFVGRSRALDLDKPPGLAEAIDWVSALQVLGVTSLDPVVAGATIGSIAKTPDDVAVVRGAIDEGALVP